MRVIIEPDYDSLSKWAANYVANRIILDRRSYDFGRPKWHLLDSLKVPATYRGMQIIYKFDDYRDDFLVSEELQIEYVSI